MSLHNFFHIFSRIAIRNAKYRRKASGIEKRYEKHG
jgi:hypothetical protein